MTKNFNKNTGFTMVELIIVVGILAVLIVYLVSDFGLKGDDAKSAVVRNILSKDIPAALSTFAYQNNGCVSPVGRDLLVTNDNAEPYTDENTGYKILLDNGVPAGTPWVGVGTAFDYTEDHAIWTAEFTPATTTSSGYLDVTYPLLGSGNPEAIQTIIANALQGSPDVHSVNGATGRANSFVTIDGLIDADAEGVLSVRYPCA